MDFRQAYDSIRRGKLYQILHDFNTPSELMRLVRMIITNTKASSNLTDFIKINCGLKQVDRLAPLLFNLAPECYQETISREKCNFIV